MTERGLHIYVGEIPYSEKGSFWVSFESDPNLKRTRADIYGKCLPCIQHLYSQLKEGVTEIDLTSPCPGILSRGQGFAQFVSLSHERLVFLDFPGL
jgi:hypothetical protein